MECLTDQTKTNNFYVSVLKTLNDANIPFLVGGACMLERITGIVRPTKDFDLHVRPEQLPEIFAVLDLAGYQTEMTFSHWLGKVFQRTDYIDIIFSSGNGLCRVDQEWFDHAIKGEIFGLPVLFCAPEEAIWSKAFIMERERYDGADIAHLLLAAAQTMDWSRLLRRFGGEWRVLLSHLVLFGFIYPGKAGVIPAWLLDELWQRLRAESTSNTDGPPLCRGTQLSRSQYLYDLENWGYIDARLHSPSGAMSAEDVERWTHKALHHAK
jgi:hypothetical protein